MGPAESPSKISLATTLDAVGKVGDSREPVTASEVAEVLDCSRRTAYDKLDALADRGDLRSKKTGARGRIWWEPVSDDATALGSGRTVEHAEFEELVDSVSNYAIFALDPSGHVVSWNQGAAEMKGYEAGDIVGEHFSTFYTESDLRNGIPERNLEKATEYGYVEDEGWRVREDGTRFWANVTITAIRDDEGDLQGFLKVTRDMTDRRRYEEALRQERDRFESLVQEVEDYAIFMLDPDGYVQSWNSGIERIKGYEEAEIVGEHFSTFYTEAARNDGIPERNLEAAVENGRTHDEGWRVRKDGSTFWADVTITALTDDDDGELRGFAKVTRDMTDQHEHEERLLQQRQELDELNTINADIREIDRTLVAARTREEIETQVCQRLAASEFYTAAWIGEVRPTAEELETRAREGLDDAGPGALSAPDSDPDDGPTDIPLARQALESESIQVHRYDGDERPATDAEALESARIESVAFIPLVYEDVDYGVLAVYAADSAAFDERKTAVLDELGEAISHAIASIERREREETLTMLHESTRALLAAETRQEIGDIVVSTAIENLEMAGALVYDFDTAENVLSPLTVSKSIERIDASVETFTPGNDSTLWDTFVDGEAVVVQQAEESVFPTGGALGLHESMIVPLGDHGVLAVGSTAGGTFDPKTQKLVALLGSTAEAAFNRVESEANLRKRDEALQEQNRRLRRLNELNSVVREVDKRLVGATTRAEIQRDVCDVLTTVDRFRLVWIGDQNAQDEQLTPVAWDGSGRGYLDSVVMGDEDGMADPSITTHRTGEITVVSNVADDLRAAPWRGEAFSREFQSVISVPITYGDHRYGVLTVYADRPGMFGEMEQAIFAELGYTIAHAINTVEMKEALFADQVTELEFRLPPDADYVLPRLAAETGAEVEFEGVISGSEAGARLFATARDDPNEAVLGALEQSAAVDSARLLADHDDGSLFEAVVTGRALATMLAEHNGSLRTLSATPETVSATVDVPSSTNVREFIEHFETECPGIEFVARRERDRPLETRERFRSRIESALTQRQLEVLKLAYHGGYFESPRSTTGGDLAEALDISQSTVTTHLRAAQRHVLDHLLDETGSQADAGDGEGEIDA